MKINISNPKDKETRTIRKFAWLPIRIENNNLIFHIWLEFYYIDQEFQEGQEYKSRYWKELNKRIK